MSDNLNLPILPLDDTVVLPGMVVPVPLGETEIRAAVDAARAARTDENAKAEVLLVPRLGGKYSNVGTIGVIEQLGRLPGGEQVAVVRGTNRVRIGSGTTGPGAALWVEASVQEEVADEATPALAREYKALAVTILQQRGAYQFVDNVQSMSDPSMLADLAGYAGYLTDEQKVWLLETTDVSERLTKLIEWGREHLAELDVSETIRKDVQEGMDKQQREFLLRKQLAAVRKELSELDGSVEIRGAGLPRPGRGRRPAREGQEGRADRGRQARAHVRAVA